MKTDSVCKLWRTFLHFQKFVTRVLWIFMYVVKYMSSLKLPLFVLSYLGRSLKYSGSSPWEVLGAWRSKYSVVSQQEVPLWKKPQLFRGTLVWAMAFSLTSCLLADLQYQTKQKGTAKKHIQLKVPWEDEYSSRRLVSDGRLGRKTVCRSFITMCSLLPCKRISAVCALGQVS